MKLSLLRSIVISVLRYGCESWTYSEVSTIEDYCASLGLRDRRTNESVKEQVEDLAGVQKPLIQIAQERKMKFFGHVTRHPSELS